MKAVIEHKITSITLITICVLFFSACKKDGFGSLHVVTYSPYSPPGVVNNCFYGDHFDDNVIPEFTYSASYSISENSSFIDAYINTGPGTFDPITYNLPGSFDLTGIPKIHIGCYVDITGGYPMELFLEDINGHLTSMNPTSINVTNTYQELVFDVSNAIAAGDDGSIPPYCTGGGCSVDGTQITRIHIMIDRASGFSGTLFMDHMQLGDGSCFTGAVCINPDHFDDNTVNGNILYAPGIYAISESNSEMVVTITKSAGAYDPITYNLATDTDMNIHNMLHIRARVNTTSVPFQVVLRDVNGNVTSTAPINVSINNSYQTFHFDVTNAITSGDNGSLPTSTCIPGPCPFLGNQVTAIELSINPTNAYNGDLIIDYLEIGSGDCFAAPAIGKSKLRGSLVGIGNPGIIDHGFKVEYLPPFFGTQIVSLGEKESFGNFFGNVSLPSGSYHIKAFAVSEFENDTLFGTAQLLDVPF